MSNFIRTGIFLILVYGTGADAHAAGDPVKGKELFIFCMGCHGQNAEGVSALQAPANAGQDLWYMFRQMNNYRAGIRGVHPNDTFGAQMRPMALTLTDEQAVQDVVAYIGTLDTPDPQATIEGDIEAGKKAYETCIPCHGAYGEGVKTLDAPRLSKQYDWYLVSQLNNFKADIRGTHQNDIYGAQMRIMAQMLETDEQVRNVAAYIATLEYIPGQE